MSVSSSTESSNTGNSGCNSDWRARNESGNANGRNDGSGARPGNSAEPMREQQPALPLALLSS
jgi:hypothetical protein